MKIIGRITDCNRRSYSHVGRIYWRRPILRRGWVFSCLSSTWTSVSNTLSYVAGTIQTLGRKMAENFSAVFSAISLSQISKIKQIIYPENGHTFDTILKPLAGFVRGLWNESCLGLFVSILFLFGIASISNNNINTKFFLLYLILLQ